MPPNDAVTVAPRYLRPMLKEDEDGGVDDGQPEGQPPSPFTALPVDTQPSKKQKKEKKKKKSQEAKDHEEASQGSNKSRGRRRRRPEEAASSESRPPLARRRRPQSDDSPTASPARHAAVDLNLRSRSAELHIKVGRPPDPPPPRPRGERRPRSPDSPPRSAPSTGWSYSNNQAWSAPPNQCPVCGAILKARGGEKAVQAALAAHQKNSTKCQAIAQGHHYMRPNCPHCGKAVADNDWAREQHSWHCRSR